MQKYIFVITEMNDNVTEETLKDLARATLAKEYDAFPNYIWSGWVIENLSENMALAMGRSLAFMNDWSSRDTMSCLYTKEDLK